MAEQRTELLITAPAERIWELLCDLKLYQHWNPLFPRAAGTIEQGKELELTVHLPNMTDFTIRPVLTDVEAPKLLAWRHSFLTSLIFTWEYRIELEPAEEERLKIVQRSVFKGLLAPLFSFALSAPLREAQDHLNRALTRWGEKGNVRCLKC